VRTTRITCTALLGLIALFVLAGVAPALASGPTIQVVQIDQTVVAPAATQTCGFTILRHDVGTVRFIIHYDGAGNPVREVDVYHLNETFIANGLSITGRNMGPDNITYNTDGSTTILSAGPQAWTISLGGGPVWGTAGSVVTNVDASGNETTVRESGPDYTFDTALCAALTP
jgi:hypothetical protein